MVLTPMMDEGRGAIVERRDPRPCDQNESLVLKAFRGAPGLKRKPRSPGKAAWLREQGIDPDRPYASWDLPKADERPATTPDP